MKKFLLISTSVISMYLTAAATTVYAQDATEDLTVRWVGPTERYNGDPISVEEIDGYELWYREQSEEEWTKILITDGAQDEYVVNDVPVGSYDFIIAAYDTDGLYGQFSDPTNHVVVPENPPDQMNPPTVSIIGEGISEEERIQQCQQSPNCTQALIISIQ